MPITVIDLLSSPEPAFNRQPSTKAAVPRNEQQLSTTSYAPPNAANGAWFTLSSDDEDGQTVPLLKLKPTAPKPLTEMSMDNSQGIRNTPVHLKSSSSLCKTSLQAKYTLKSKDEAFFMSDDFDSTVDLDHSVTVPPASSTGILGLDRRKMEEERLARIARSKIEAVELPPEEKVATAQKYSNSAIQNITLEDPFDFGDTSSNRCETTASLPRQVKPTCGSSNNGVGGLRKRKASETILLSSEDDPFELNHFPTKKRQPLSNVLAEASGSKSSQYRRSISTIETSSQSNNMKPKPSALSRSKSAIVESDPIMFTSSPDYHAEAAKRRNEKKLPPMDVGEDDDVFGFGLPSHSGRSKRPRDTSVDESSDSLPDINAMVWKTAGKSKYRPPSNLTGSDALEKYHADKEKDRKTQEKSQEKIQKAVEKERRTKEKEEEKERKRIAKVGKAKEKENAAFLAKVNILKVDKKVSTPEMIVRLPSSLKEKVKDATRTFLQDLSVKTYDYESELPIVKWQRKVEAEWDIEARYFRPCELQIKEEKHVMYVMSAEEFVQFATSEEGNDLDSHVLRLKTMFESFEIIYLIEGLGNWMRKNKTIKNRGFTEAVRNEINSTDISASQKSRKKKVAEYVDEDLVEHALLKLQVVHGVLIHHSQAMEYTPEWIRSFTQHISTIPYKMQQRSMDTSFCMESGQVQVGNGTQDTFVKMLQEMTRITAPIAHGIIAEYPSVQKLIVGLQEGGPLALADLRTMANKDGAFADRRIGPAISKRVHTVFTSRDEGRDDV